jgi:hypothetical protein
MIGFQPTNFVQVPIWGSTEGISKAKFLTSWELRLDQLFTESVDGYPLLRDSLIDQEEMPSRLRWRDLVGSRILLLDAGILLHSLSAAQRCQLLPAICLSLLLLFDMRSEWYRWWERFLFPGSDSVADHFADGKSDEFDQKFFDTIALLNHDQRWCIAECVDRYFRAKVDDLIAQGHERERAVQMVDACDSLVQLWRDGKP